ncbi:MAG TPA: transcriptional repressor LexA [Pyrinomonadaceae bacterium]|nr:transcriptional repressor LexA [Pyrinomonadaceae bacterium]
MQPRTRKQREVLDYITRFIERHGYEPSYAQIARHFRVSSKATIAKHIESLERQGLLTRRRADGGFGLNVRVEEVSGDAVCEVPLLGRVAAGQPLDTVTDSETISVPRFMLGRSRPAQVYALRVTGDSMIDEHICDGDIALIENRTEARNGEIVVALVDGQRATLKRLERAGTEVELCPANSNHEPIRLHASRVAVQGIFRGLLRPAN